MKKLALSHWMVKKTKITNIETLLFFEWRERKNY